MKIENFTEKNSKKLHTQKNGPSGAPGPASASPWRAERGTKFRKKNLTVPKKLKVGTLWYFPTSILSQNSTKKLKGDPLGKKIPEKKSRSAEKIGRGDPLVPPGMVWYAEKQKKPFWFSSLDQIVQFGAIIFCRTLKNYFGQFVWIEKKEKPLN